MNCLDCAAAGQATPAVGVCHDCGAGICLDHVVTSPHHLTRSAAVAMEVNVEPPGRMLRCELCNTAFEAADSYRPAAARNRTIARG